MQRNKLIFDERTHTYWYNHIRYRSCTQAIGLFENEFDEETQSQIAADKRGRTPEYWLKYWKDLNEVSLLRGDDKHSLMESIVKSRSIDVINGKPFRVQNTELFPEDITLRNFPDGLYTEEKICRHDYQVAGKPDKFAIETVLRHRYVHIDDYKTNKRLRTRSFQYKNGLYEMLKKPLSHLMDCEMVKYSLQLSMYMSMFEYHGYKVGNMRLIHFPHIPEMAPPGAEEPPPVVYPIEYQKADVISMLSYLKRKQII